MTENPYQTPKSALEDKKTEKITRFYVVSIKKFTILFFSTLGLYTIFWFYKNWKQYKIYSGERIWPVPRSIFNIFFTHSLFREVRNSLLENKKSFNWHTSFFATAYIITSLASNVLDRLSMNEIGSPYTDLLGILILPLMYLTLVKPQKAINISLNDPDGSANSKLTVANYAWIFLGIVLWAGTIVGLADMFGYLQID